MGIDGLTLLGWLNDSGKTLLSCASLKAPSFVDNLKSRSGPYSACGLHDRFGFLRIERGDFCAIMVGLILSAVVLACDGPTPTPVPKGTR